MAHDLRLSQAAANAEADALGALLDGGFLYVFGTVKPASADDDPGGPALAAQVFGSPAFSPATDGLLTSNPLAPDMNTAGGGDAAWFRATAVDGTPVFDGIVGLVDCDINLKDPPGLTIQPGGELHIATIQYRIKKVSP